ncbi:putative serine protease K12H4.7 [Onthophagus taurus]|uniref:putative serine protease K12H4.7 n=1 Tax=Onthophagus taurus TaxID=166361 RepID=UPI0039BE177A
MKSFAFFVLLIAIHLVNSQHFLKSLKHGPPKQTVFKKGSKAAVWDTISQRVDHFNPVDLREWEMRYIYNDQFYKPGGPLFIFLGGEWEIDEGYIRTGQMFDMANEHNGYMFYTEHRYYGRSQPVEDFTTENLKYLSLDQATADVAYFIQHQKSHIEGAENSKVVVVGGSYSATMATWIRKKYPHLVDAALASSAPLLAQADFIGYFQVVADNFRLSSDECMDTVTEGIRMLEGSLDSVDGLENMSSMFGTCDPIDVTEPERSYFFSSLANPFAYNTQYAQPGDIDEACKLILSTSGSAVEKLAGYIRYYYGGYCISDFQYFVDYYKDTAMNYYDSYRQWSYQTCTEYGFFQTGNQTTRPFGDFWLQMYIDTCQELFGTGEEILNTGIERTNLFYGALEPEVTRVVSVHGTVDPWHALGVLEDINEDAPVIVVEGTSHCADLSSISENDLPQLREAKLRVQQYIRQWIS